VSFRGEPGIDDGGPTREGIVLAAVAMTRSVPPALCLLDETEAYVPNIALITTDPLALFTAGVVFGTALAEGCPLTVRLAPHICAFLAGCPLIDPSDDVTRGRAAHAALLELLSAVRPSYAAGLRWLEGNSVSLLPEAATFVVPALADPLNEPPVALFDGGDTTVVTEENQQQFIALAAFAGLYGAGTNAVAALQLFRAGFVSTVGDLAACLLSGVELSDLLCAERVNVTAWRRNAVYAETDSNHPSVASFWAAAADMTDAELRLLLSFSTGLAGPPPGMEFTQRGVQRPFTLAVHTKPGLLPFAQTCANILRLPMLQAPDAGYMKERLLFAATHAKTFSEK
jgi:hypothetical protein